MFLTEVLNKSVKEQTHANELAQFLADAFISLDKMARGIENFHLIFLIHLSRHLGFGVYQTREILAPFDADQAEQKLLEELLRADFDTVLTLNQSQRRNLLDVLLRFYAMHIETFGEMKSLAVVREMVN